MTTLYEAITRGRGSERTFNCHVHDDRNASASVNVLKGVWVCYACGAKGRIDGPVEIDPTDLLSEVNGLLGDIEVTVYPESWLALYTGPCEYWEQRFTQEAIEHFQLGFDPAKEMPCYPLRAANQSITGLVYRDLDPMTNRKYKYPFGTVISNYLFNYRPENLKAVILVEGAADAIALWEVGVEAFAIYGTRPSYQQMRMIQRVDPDLVVCAFDQDSAGRNASVMVSEMLPDYEVVVARWSEDDGKDPAELTPEQRTSYIGLLVI